MNDLVGQEIRSVDKKTLIFFEGITFDNFYVGFDDVPGGSEYKNKSVLSFHHYFPLPNIFPLTVTMFERCRDAERLEVGMMLTEFDVMWETVSGVDNGYQVINGGLLKQIATADEYRCSWMVYIS